MFASIFASSPEEALGIDVERLDRMERLAPGATSVPATSELSDSAAPAPTIG
jgi:hypothetical protein